LLHAAKWLVADLLSTLAFVGLYAATHNIYVAVAFAIALGLGQIAWQKSRGTPIDLMQWLSLFLVVVFGAAALVTRDPAFVMVKPSIIYTAIGLVMLRPGWMNRYFPPIARDNAADVITVFGFIWAALMFGTAAANLGLVFSASAATWAWFIAVFPIASKVGLVLIQYVVIRAIIRRRIRASREAIFSA
jgi:intracellular septation protein A